MEAVLSMLGRRKPNSGEAAIALGDFYSKVKQPDKAVAEYQRGLAIDHDNLELKQHLVDAYLASGRIGEAAGLNKQVLQTVPKDFVAHVANGCILLAQAKRDDAILQLPNQVTEAP